MAWKRDSVEDPGDEVGPKFPRNFKVSENNDVIDKSCEIKR